MNRARLLSAATLTMLTAASLFAAAESAAAQQPPAPELHHGTRGQDIHAARSGAKRRSS